MLFETGHAKEYPFMQKKRHAPLHCFLHIGAGGVCKFAEVEQDLLRKIGGLRDVGIDARVFLGHGSVNLFIRQSQF